ncbi:unnamed protein product [Staurois parvus]|uniref:Transposase n=1 Tax=Staurois parvus TaxID=386267 RepID=A0ABN9D818_9NEOB|nr:unnamed protein product [Staurois parvus]
MIDRKLEQKINIKFCVKIGKSVSKTLVLLQQAYDEHFMNKSNVFEWHRQFKEVWENVHNDARNGQPEMQRTNVHVDRLRALICSGQRLSVRMMTEELNMNRETRQILMEDLGLRKFSAKMVPRILREERMLSSNFI